MEALNRALFVALLGCSVFLVLWLLITVALAVSCDSTWKCVYTLSLCTCTRGSGRSDEVHCAGQTLQLASTNPWRKMLRVE